jgi:hypothetical protein
MSAIRIVGLYIEIDLSSALPAAKDKISGKEFL